MASFSWFSRLSRAFCRASFVLAAWSAVLASACRVQPLEVGQEDARESPEAGADAATVADAAPEADAATLESTLLAKCAAPEGARDPYGSGAALSARLLRRWFFCGAEAESPLPGGVGIALDMQGNYTLLRWSAAHDAFIESADPDERGKVTYFAFSDVDAGAGADAGQRSEVIAADDASPHTGIFVYLSRTTMTDLSFVADFDKDPRRLILREAGPSAVFGRFVPID